MRSLLSQTLDDALLLALVLSLTVQCRRRLVGSRSNSNVGSDSLRAKAMDGLVA